MCKARVVRFIRFLNFVYTSKHLGLSVCNVNMAAHISIIALSVL